MKNALSAAEKARFYRVQRSPTGCRMLCTQGGRWIYKHSITDLQILSSPRTSYINLYGGQFFCWVWVFVAAEVLVGLVGLVLLFF